jgi:hypothetical protein
MAVQLATLRRLGGHEAWAKLRRLAIVAPCCKEESLIEVMDTEPRCVLLPPVAVSQNAMTRLTDGEPRGRWQGFGRGGGPPGIVWLFTFEQMAKTNLKQWLWCRHHRFYISAAPVPKPLADAAVWIPLDDVLTGRGRHILSLTDKLG